MLKDILIIVLMVVGCILIIFGANKLIDKDREECKKQNKFYFQGKCL